MAPSLKQFHQQLRDNLSGEVDFAAVTRGMFATDASHYQIVPAGVVFPRDENDVVETMELAREHGVPVTARGAGTSLSGQTHGPGIILDCSRYMDKILSVDVEARTARVQPGVIRDSLNAAVAEHGLHFAPDPATTSRCTIGGMIGNNSAGMRSVYYGQTSDHVVSARVVLATGEVVEFAAGESLGAADAAHKAESAAADPVVERLRSGLAAIIAPRRDEIATRYPAVPRQVGGYALDQFKEESGSPATWNLARLLCGSEGTLAILLDVVVRLEPIPAQRALCVVSFASLDAALRPLPAMLEHGPTAIELLDEIVLGEAVVNPSTRDLCGFLDTSSGVPAALQVVEFSGGSAEQDARDFAAAMLKQGVGESHPVMADAAAMKAVWEVRRLGLGLITNTPGPKKGQAFIEDACLPVAVLADYIRDVQAICSEHGLTACVYAHASVGVLHVRPMLDLHKEADIERMRVVAEAVFERVLHYGGAWSGEHGDGIVRGEFVERYFGSELMQAFREVKTLFDPDNLLNPNKLIDPPPMTTHLRYQQSGYARNAVAADRHSHFQYRSQGGITAAVEQCNGVGACRKLGAGVMCPSFRATRREADCTRGRANALRLAISGQLDKIGGKGTNGSKGGGSGLAHDGLADVMSLCLGCKACKSECPNAVDVAKFKAEVLQARHDIHGPSPAARLIGSSADMASRVARFRPLVPLANFGAGILGRTVGFDPRRPMPLIAPRSLTALARNAELGQVAAEEADVILFNDTSTNLYDPEIGIAALELLRELGHRVHLATVGDSQRARISQGLLRDAKRAGAEVLERLRAVAGTKPVIVLEPSCASALIDDLPDLMEFGASPPAPLDIVLLPDFLVRTGAKVGLSSDRILIHGHCHHKAVFGLAGLRALLPQAEIIEAGCCGMAGAFGFQHYELSIQIGEDRLFPAVRSAPAGTVFVADGFSCRHQIEHACRVEVLHLAQVLAAVRHTQTEFALNQ